MRNKKIFRRGVVLLLILFAQLIPMEAFGASQVTLDAPDGGQNLKVGSSYYILWHFDDSSYLADVITATSALGGYVAYKLEYSTDSGLNYKEIAEVDLQPTSYNWTVPNTLSNKVRVRVSLISVIKNWVTQKYDISNLAVDASESDLTISESITIPKVPINPLPIKLAPAAPGNLTASVVSAAEIQIAWQDNSANETQFKLERSIGNNSSYTEVAALDANTTNYADKVVTPLTKYYYRIKAVNGIGSSTYSSEVSATTPPLAQPPQPQQTQPPQTQTSQKTVVKFYLGSTDFLVNAQLQTMDASPVSINGRTMLPIKYVAQPLGATTAWDPASKKVTVTRGDTVIELWVGNNTARVNGQDKLIDPNNTDVKPIILPPGRTMIPLRFIGENLDCQVDWNPAQYEASITYPQ